MRRGKQSPNRAISQSDRSNWSIKHAELRDRAAILSEQLGRKVKASAKEVAKATREMRELATLKKQGRRAGRTPRGRMSLEERRKRRAERRE